MTFRVELSFIQHCSRTSSAMLRSLQNTQLQGAEEVSVDSIAVGGHRQVYNTENEQSSTGCGQARGVKST